MDLNPIAENIWTLTVPQAFKGVHINNAMTIVRLPSGKIWLHSPADLTPLAQTALKEFPEIQYAVAPNKKHYLHLDAFSQYYPGAKIYGAPNLQHKLSRLRPSVSIDQELGSEAPPEWEDIFSVQLIEGLPVFEEVVFLHKPSKTLITTDLLFNMGSVRWSPLRKAISLTGLDKPRGLFAERILPMPRKNQKIKSSLERILSWDFSTILMAHGDPVKENAKNVLKDCYKRFLAKTR